MFKRALFVAAGLLMWGVLAGQGCPAPAGDGGSADTGGDPPPVDTGGNTGGNNTGGNTAPVPLVANAGPDQRVDVTTTATFAGSATGGTPPYTYAWARATGVEQTLTDGNTAAAKVTNAQLGTTTFRLTVTDAANATATDEITLNVTLAAIVRLVKQDATGAKNGTSWTDAYTDLQDALKEAVDSKGQITEIWVAAGNHKPSPTDQAVYFDVPNGVALYGGFRGDETRRDQRSATANVTTLTGDLKGDDGPNLTNRTDNSRTIVSMTDGNSATILDGFTIRSGTSDGGAAGVRIYGGNPTVSNCTFLANAGTGGSSRGAALYLYGKTSASISDCSFISNSAQLGGAVNCDGSSPTFTKSIFRSNTADRASAMYLALSTVSLTDCTFDQNVSQTYGAIEASQTPLQVLRCTFTKNRSNNSISGAINLSSNSRIINSIFGENYAKFGGGAMDIRTENITIAGCLFYRNTADSSSGGAVYTQGKSVRLINCTIVYNKAFNGGGGVYFTEPDTVLSNCILWGNTLTAMTTVTVEELQLDGNSPNLAPTMNYSCVQGLSGKLGGSGNINKDPLFQNAGGNNFRLQSNSPCVNAGDSSAVPFDMNTDLDGGIRFLGTPPVVDMGAYER